MSCHVPLITLLDLFFSLSLFKINKKTDIWSFCWGTSWVRVNLLMHWLLTFLSLDSCFSLNLSSSSSSWKRSASLIHSLITTFYLWCQACLFFSFSSFVSDDLINLLLPVLLTRILSDVLSVAAVFLSVSHTDVYLLHSSWIQVIL